MVTMDLAISYRFRDRRRFQSKIAKFSHALVFCAFAECVLLVSGYRRWEVKKTRIMGLLGR